MNTSWVAAAVVVVLAIVAMRQSSLFEINRDMNRIYRNSTTVQQEYNSWTQDGILEYYWGHHIHLGYYPNKTSSNVDFRQAKIDMTFTLFKWAHKVTNRDAENIAPNTLSLLDAGCGFGGSTMALTNKYKLKHSIGITLSDYQVARGKKLLIETKENNPYNKNVEFRVADALNIDFEDNTFDIVWSLEMEPHIPDKSKMIDQFLRVLKPNGLLILGCWNIRDTNKIKLNEKDKKLVWFLENEWGHPNFWSIDDYKKKFESHEQVNQIYVDNWTEYTLPSWYESLYEIIRRPKMLFWAILHPSCWNDRWGDLMGLMNMDSAFRSGLMEYGIFAVTKK